MTSSGVDTENIGQKLASIPDRVADAVSRRIARIRPETKRRIETGIVIGILGWTIWKSLGHRRSRGR